ncbi:MULTISPECIES: DUF2278 family protein [unclassified Methylocaldum]|jgi:uncharacterized protein YukJ|uniref:DUF2278 family protein n=1 Tax=unclassified Methylocaldum TaxID=2622260 RepID=UPI00098A96DF|nr:DUF2278 family protein [Methylocaldum sp. 14B]
MPLKNYGVLRATPVDRHLGTGDNPHYQILAVDDQDRYRLAVNVKSKLWPSELSYLIVPHFRHPITESLEQLEPGWHKLPSKPGGVALDYIRGNLFGSFAEMTPLPFSVPGPDNDLNEKIDRYVQRAMASENAWVYAFGEPWGPENKRDKIFGFAPGRGVHDIHMNQGNADDFVKDDGVWQDGGLLFWYADQQEWVALFLKFQSQAIHTDDRTGHMLPEEPGGPPAEHGLPPRPTPVWPPTHAVPDGLVRIVAAKVNTIESPEDETVILLNTSPRPIDLDGWALLDRAKHRKPLTGTLNPGEPMIIHVRPDIELSNQGGIISLLNAEGLKVHGVSYTRDQAREPGWTLVF